MISLTFDSCLPELLSFLTGVISCIGGLYGYSRSKGVKLLPAALEGSISLDEALKQIQEHLTENEKAEANFKKQIKTALQNISLTELVDIIKKAEEYGIDGYSAGEAEDLGIMLIKAARSKEDNTSTGAGD